MNNHPIDKFVHRFPEAGTFHEGALLTGENAQQFATIIGNKVRSLSRKAVLSEVEKTFIDRTMDLSVRSIIYAAERQGLPVVQGRAARATATSVAKLRELTELPLDRLVDEMGGITGNRFGLRDNSAPRVLVEDTAIYGIQLFGQMTKAAGGVQLDRYLEGNLQEIANQYDAVDRHG